MNTFWNSALLRYPNLDYAIIWLGIIAGAAIVLGALSRTKFVGTFGKAILAVTSLIYVYGLYQTALLVITSQWADVWPIAILIAFTQTVFMLGTTLACSRVQYHGGLAIRSDSFIYEAVNKIVPTEYHWEKNSLCGASWGVMGVIVLMGALWGIVLTAGIIIALILFLYNGRNPVSIFYRTFEYSEVQAEDKKMVWWGSVPRSPGLFGVLATLGVVMWVTFVTPETSKLAADIGGYFIGGLAFFLVATWVLNRWLPANRRLRVFRLGFPFAICVGITAGFSLNPLAAPFNNLVVTILVCLMLVIGAIWLEAYKQRRSQLPTIIRKSEVVFEPDEDETAELLTPSPVLSSLAAACSFVWNMILSAKGVLCPRIKVID